MWTKRRRLNTIKSFIDARLAQTRLSPERTAEANGISIRNLHHLFRAPEACP